MLKKMKVLMLPAGQDEDRNPYTALLRRSLEKDNVGVLAGNRLGNCLGRCDAIHVHWPQCYADGGSLGFALLRSVALLCLCALHRLRGARVVWTVHDLHSFQERRPKLEALVMALFRAMTTSLIFLSERSRAALYEKHPGMMSRDWCIAPHGLYGDSYPAPDSKPVARDKIGAGAASVLLLCPGDIKPYKNIPNLVREFSGTTAYAAKLMLAGECDPPAHAEDLKAAIAGVTSHRTEVTWLDLRPDNAQLATLIDAADAVILPYSISWNSGMAILALERGRRIITSNADAFLDLEDEVGSYWVTIARDGFASSLQNFRARDPSPAELQALHRFKQERAWEEIARRTAALYSRPGQRLGRNDNGSVPATTGGQLQSSVPENNL